MSQYKSKLPDRRKTQDAIIAAGAAIQTMSADLGPHERTLYAIYPPLANSGWTIETVDSAGNIWEHHGDTLDAAYWRAIWWPGEPPPF
jgi:hypothetical protein